MLISFRRVLKSGWEKFVRDQSSTGAALTVMVVILFVISSLYILQGMSSFLITTLEENVDVSAYFKDTTSENEILQIRDALLDIEEVKEVEYVSKGEALERFLETHEGDEKILEPLRAIGSNPFLPSLNIKAHDVTQYENISDFLADESFASVIENVDFHERAPVIERLILLTTGIRTGILVVIIALSLITILVAFNTIRLTIYNSKEEIEIMRLVGASNWFIRGPFLIQGILVGVVASIIALGALFGITYVAGAQIELFTGFDITGYLSSQFLTILLLQLAVGIGLGVISSMIAIRRYLQV